MNKGCRYGIRHSMGRNKAQPSILKGDSRRLESEAFVESVFVESVFVVEQQPVAY